MTQLTNLEKAIIETIAFFDIFDYPLTSFEIWKWLFYKIKNQKSKIKNNPTLRLIFELLEKNDYLLERIEQKNGFYFLKGREHIIKIRQDRYKIAYKKYKTALKMVRILALIPFVRMIAVVNTLAYSNAQEESDIDFFIVTQQKRIWMSRFFSTALAEILGWRTSRAIANSQQPTANNQQLTANSLCLSFFVTENNLNLESIGLKSQKSKVKSQKSNDVYLYYWISQIVPLYEPPTFSPPSLRGEIEGGVSSLYSDFWTANQWIKNFLPNVFLYQLHQRRRVKVNLALFYLKRFFEFCHSFAFDGITEKFYQWLQLKIMPKKIKEMANQDSRVILSNQMLKFHLNDRREYYQRVWMERIL